MKKPRLYQTILFSVILGMGLSVNYNKSGLSNHFTYASSVKHSKKNQNTSLKEQIDKEVEYESKLKPGKNFKYYVGKGQQIIDDDSSFKSFQHGNGYGVGTAEMPKGNLVHIIKRVNLDGYEFDKVVGVKGDEKSYFYGSWIYAGDLSTQKNAQPHSINLTKLRKQLGNEYKKANPNAGAINSIKKSDKNMDKYYTSDELNQIQQYRQASQSIGNLAGKTNIYTTLPSYKNTFALGQLNPTYIDNVTKWTNFFRGMYGLSPVINDSEWNEDAQYGAVDTAAGNEVTPNGEGGQLSHGLGAFNVPSYVPSDAWSRGVAATNESNLGGGFDSSNTPYEVVGSYLNDDGNADPGHRDWVLGGINKIGVGMANGYYDFKVFDNSSTPTPEKTIEFPKANLFSYDLAYGTYWSLSLPSGSFDSAPQVTVFDNTDHTNVSVSDVHVYTQGYGNFSSAVAYQPDDNYIKLNHSYTITITGTPNGTYSYTTKLFNLGYTVFNHQD